MPGQLRPWFIAANTVALAVAIGIAAAGWWPIYQDLHFVVLVAVTVVLGSALAILGAVFRWTAAVMVPATVILFALSGVALAVPTEAVYGVVPTLQGELDLFSSVALGWKQLLTITLPVASYQGLLVPVFVSVLIATVGGLSAALRSRRGDVAAVAPVILFLVGLAFGSRVAAWPLSLSLSLLAVLLLWLMWRRWYRRRAAIHLLGTSGPQRTIGVRTVVSAVVVLAIAGAGSVAATLAIPPTVERSVLRSAIEQPFDPRAYPSPLAGFRQYLREDLDNAVLFTVDGLPAETRLRIATLDTYDGVVYSVGSDTVTSESGSFDRVPYRFDQSSIEGDQVSVEVTIGEYSGVWLPTVGKFESLEFDGARASSLRDAFYYNNTSGTAAVIGGLTEGDEYRLTAVVPTQPSEAELRSATAGAASVPALGAVPAELTTRLEEYSSAVDGQGAKLVAVLEGLRADGYISHGLDPDGPLSRSGHSADRITELLTETRMIGDDEQYAVAAALMARELGFPARVVFGFTPGETGSGPTEITGDMVSAWVEVDTAQYGWVAVDPTPAEREIPEEEPEEPATVSRPQSVIQPPIEEQEITDDQSPTEAIDNEQDQAESWLGVLLAVVRVLGWVLLAAGLLASPFLLVIAAKLRRRALRRAAPTPLQRITGGWREFEDAVLDHGFAPAPSSTRSEFAATIGGQKSLGAAAVADRAAFAPSTPSADEAAKLWRSVDELVASLNEGTTRWQRLRAHISVRSLGGYSVRSLFGRQGSRPDGLQRGQ